MSAFAIAAAVVLGAIVGFAIAYRIVRSKMEMEVEHVL